MNEPITGQEPTPATPLFFELETEERAPVLKDFVNNWGDIITECAGKNMTLSYWAQSRAPHPTQPNEPESALASMLEMAGIFLKKDVVNGVHATPFNHADTGWKRALVLEGLKRSVTSNLLGFIDDPEIQKLASGDSSADYEPGSAVIPKIYMPLRDGSRLTAFPPLSAVAREVILQVGQLVLPEFTENQEHGPGPHAWTDGSEIYLDSAHISSRDINPKAIAGGFKISDGLWNSPVGMDFAQIRANRYRVRTERILVKEMLGKINANWTTENTKDIGLDGSTYSADVITEITMLFQEQDFVITSLFANHDTTKKYLNIDRSKFRYDSGPRTTQGEAAGIDRYGKMPSDRLVYDVNTNQTTIANDNMIGIDAMETGSVYIMEETSRDTVLDLERSRAFSYTLKYLTTLNQTDGDPRRLLT